MSSSLSLAGKREVNSFSNAKILHKPHASFNPLRAIIIRSLRPLHKVHRFGTCIQIDHC
jgi:hypothetical protein